MQARNPKIQTGFTQRKGGIPEIRLGIAKSWAGILRRKGGFGKS
jgi:hypothetical protein